MVDLFSTCRPLIDEIYPDCFVLSNFVETNPFLAEVNKITAHNPFRKMMTPNGYSTGISLTNCGHWGWTSDESAYRYSKLDPISKKPWLPIPELFLTLAKNAANIAGFKHFEPDACLINQYLIGEKLGSHQDKNEKDYTQPIVSLSIGLSAIFQVFGDRRSGVKVNYQLQDGDVMVWGNTARLIYHGIRPLTADKLTPQLKQRINITLRKAS